MRHTQSMTATLPAYLAFGVLLLAGLGALHAQDSSRPATRPNILLLYVDNVGYGDLGCFGNHLVKTPRMDRLAREGVRCTDFYVVTSSCTPSRGAILTGRYPQRNGLVHQLSSTENWVGIGLPHRERILPQYLKQTGYATACFGKWNIGFAPGSRPTDRGFDEFFGFRSGNINYFAHTYHGEYDMYRKTERHQVQGYSTNLFADAAIDFIRRKAKEPWFVYLPFNAAHYVSRVNMAPGETPEWQVPGQYLERYGWPANDPAEKHRYFAVLTALDDAIGRLLDALDDLHLREQTLVMLISDNGAFIIPRCGLEVASNAPFRDGGTSCYEGGRARARPFPLAGQDPAGHRVEGAAQPSRRVAALPYCRAVAMAKRPGARWPRSLARADRESEVIPPASRVQLPFGLRLA
jgi:arylsulfatase A-like enzyme